MSQQPINLHSLLSRRAQEPAEAGPIYIEGAWIARTPTVPLDAGLPAIIRFATECWHRNLELQRSRIEADHMLAQAETALRNLTEDGLDKDVAIALAAVQRAREIL